MYINSILSYLGAWQKLQSDFPTISQEIIQAIEAVEPEKCIFSIPGRHSVRSSGPPLSIKQINLILTKEFEKLQWSVEERILGRPNRQFIDLMKDRIGVEISFYSHRIIQSDLFTKYSLFARTQLIDLMVIIVPMKSIYYRLSDRTAYFEELNKRLLDLLPISLKYPFAILGISDVSSESEIVELSSEMDSFLVKTVGFSLAEMKLSGEKERYDFKVVAPDNRALFHLAGALANQTGGGVILVGVDNDGNIKGIPRDILDEEKLRIGGTISRNCQPCPAFHLLDFDDVSNPGKCILVVHVEELENKPCVTEDKIYIRVGSESRPAKSEEIRRLLIR